MKNCGKWKPLILLCLLSLLLLSAWKEDLLPEGMFLTGGTLLSEETLLSGGKSLPEETLSPDGKLLPEETFPPDGAWGSGEAPADRKQSPAAGRAEKTEKSKGAAAGGRQAEEALIPEQTPETDAGPGAGADTGTESDAGTDTDAETGSEDYIRWVDFNVSCEALKLAYETDLDTYGSDSHVDWISLLACTAARYGGEFGSRALADLENTARRLQSGQSSLEEETEGLSSYSYYKEAYEAVLGGMVGEFLLQEQDGEGNVVWRRKYGLKAFSPIAASFPYSDSDDFGAARSYGYARPHLGHDMMGQVGTPVIAVESGYVEALGWNEYGGWRIGIRSFDKKRYYYYAHLRQNYPYAEGLEEGSVVTAGDVIGYMGHTGYSTEENVNNIKIVHLHWGLELIFDESQKESDNEIWIDCYQLSRFLAGNRSAVEKVGDTREWKRVYGMEETTIGMESEAQAKTEAETETVTETETGFSRETKTGSRRG